MQQSSSEAALSSTYRQASSQYLDAVTAQEAAQAYKRQSYSQLRIQAGYRLLDVGCGTGDDVRELAQFVGPTGQVTGVDFREDVIAEARRRAEGMALPALFEVADAHSLPFPDAAFDGCRADRVFQHLLDPTQALTELVRVTRPGGRIVVVDPDWDTLVVDAPDVATSRVVTHHGCDRARHGRMGRQLYGRFQSMGLQEVTAIAANIIITDFALASQLYHLRTFATQAQEQGLLSAESVAEWVAALEEADRAGQFFCSMTGFTVSGRKP